MGKTFVITDSSACLPDVTAAGAGVTVVPISIHLQDEVLVDGRPGTQERVLSALGAGESVKSAAPSAADYIDAIDNCAGHSVLIITPATEFTVMHRNAVIAAKVADRRVAVVDCRTAAAAHGLVVLEALKAAARGAGLDETRAVAEDAASRAELCARLETLDPLERSGRVPSPTIERARRKDLMPVFRLDQGTVEPLGVRKSSEAARIAICTEFDARDGKVRHSVAVFHSSRPREASKLGSALGVDHATVPLSPSMAVSTGAGVVGVAWLRRR